MNHLHDLIVKVANSIHKKTTRNPANWIVASPQVHSLMTRLDGTLGEELFDLDIELTSWKLHDQTK